MTQDQDKYRSLLDCPLCGCRKTHYVFHKCKMTCEKCGNEWYRPQHTPIKGDSR